MGYNRAAILFRFLTFHPHIQANPSKDYLRTTKERLIQEGGIRLSVVLHGFLVERSTEVISHPFGKAVSNEAIEDYV